MNGSNDRDYEEGQGGWSVGELMDAVRAQRKGIALALLLTVLGVGILLGIIYLLTPSERIATLPFRLEFTGAERRLYPSGVRFSTADIVGNSIIREVFTKNSLDQYVDFQEFSQSIFVVEKNEAIEALASEYQAKLANPRLDPVQRDQLEAEYQTKLESISRNDFSLNYVSPAKGTQIPRALVPKVLEDILKTWAQRAANEKGALSHQIPVLSAHILPSLDEEPIVALDQLRTRIWDVMRNIGTLRSLPGAEVLKSKQGRNLAELEMALDDVLRRYIRPLVGEMRSGQYLGDRESAIRFIESQLEHIQNNRDDAAARVTALRESLALYSEGRGPVGTSPSSDGVSSTNETVMPQLGDSFLDRIVGLAGQARDIEYRQALVDEITAASIRVIPYDREISFYSDLLRDLRSSRGAAASSDVAAPRRSMEAAREQVAVTIREANEIYQLASENLNASRTLYTIQGQPQVLTSRSLSIVRLALIGIVLILLAIPLVFAGAIIRHRRRSAVALPEGR